MVVLSIGGSLINPSQPDIVFIQNIARLLRRVSKRHPIAIVTGGGVVARQYADAVRSVGGNEFEADEAAILSTRQNAMLLIAALKGAAYPKVPLDFDEAARASLAHRIVIMGGTIPGITTDTDAALLAEKLHASRLVNLSDIDAIYSSDPKRDRHARRFSQLSYDKLIELASAADKRKAGTNFIFDLLACKIIARSGIEAHFVHGRDLDSVERAIDGLKHKGTVVR
ncbi:MAG: UMP kinase [Candidatus Micrarchaeia archaeon]